MRCRSHRLGKAVEQINPVMTSRMQRRDATGCRGSLEVAVHVKAWEVAGAICKKNGANVNTKPKGSLPGIVSCMQR